MPVLPPGSKLSHFEILEKCRRCQNTILSFLPTEPGLSLNSTVPETQAKFGWHTRTVPA